jgi:hypothetical protein
MIDLNPIKTLAKRIQDIDYEPVNVGSSGVAWTVSGDQSDDIDELAERTLELVAEVERLRKPPAVRSLDEWHEDHGTVLWWTLPICEPPYVGAPLDSDWPGYHTHWTAIAVPNRNGEP